MGIVDLSKPYGGQGKYGATFKAIAEVLKLTGRVERLRQERSLNAKVINVVATGGGPQEIAQALISAQPQYSSGATGLLQQIAEKFAPPSMLERQYGGALTEAAIQRANISPTQQIAQKKLSEINRLQSKVDEGTASQNEQAMLEKMLAGQPMVQIGLGQPASPAERKEIAETRASIDALDNLKTLFDSVQTKTGPIVGRTSPIAGLIGMTTDEQEAFMAATSAFKNSIIKEITGAQMSEQEASRIMKQVPDITDPSTRWKAKWEQSRNNLEMLQKRRAEILEQSGLRVPGGTIKMPSKGIITAPQTPISGRTAPEGQIPEDISQMSIEELLKIAQIPLPKPPPEAKEKITPVIEPETGVKKDEVAEQRSVTLSAQEQKVLDESPSPKTIKEFTNTLRHISNQNIAKGYYEKWSIKMGIIESFDSLWKPLNGKK